MPEMIPVTSSLIAAIGYNAEKKELHVEFKKGDEFLYQGVTMPIYTAMLDAQSVGSFFLRNVKGQYPHIKVL